jgi:hypothetical protein
LNAWHLLALIAIIRPCSFNRREYVVKVLLKVVDGLGVDDAVNVMQVCSLVCCNF